MAAKKHKPIPNAEGRGGIPGPVCQKSPGRTTCAYGWDTYREICRRECARPQGRVRGSAANFVPRGKHSDRVLRTKQGAVFGAVLQFLQGHSCPQEKLAKHKRTAVQIFKRTASGAENLGNGNPGQYSNFYKSIYARRKNWLSARGQRPVLCKGAATPAAKAGNRNQGISVTRMRAEMGSP